MNRLHVNYAGWGEQWRLGTLALVGGEMLFEYSEQAIAKGLRHSPLHYAVPPLNAATQHFKGKYATQGLPGFIADALPDGWGMLIMDKALRRAGREPRSVSVLERLAIVGTRALGALAFEPAFEDLLPDEELLLKDVAKEIKALQALDDASTVSASGATDAQLKHMLMLGSSPQGARPKVLLDYDAKAKRISTGMTGQGSAPWLVKFPAALEHKEVCAIEEIYARFARLGALDFPVSNYFDIDKSMSAFGVQRFDRVVTTGDTLRVPMQSLTGYLDADPRLPSLDYDLLMRATWHLCGDVREVLKAFERCVFNVLMHNRDDHGRNFAYLMREDGTWQLSPAYDLTFSHGPRGEHATSVNGYGQKIKRAQLLALATKHGIKERVAAEVIDRWVSLVLRLPKLACQLEDEGATVRKTTWDQVYKTIQACAGLLKH